MAESVTAWFDQRTMDQRGILIDDMCRYLPNHRLNSPFVSFFPVLTSQEDERVCQLVKQYGMKSWSFIARQLQGRLGKQCRERWYNHLNPDINKDPWTADEDAIIIKVR